MICQFSIATSAEEMIADSYQVCCMKTFKRNYARIILLLLIF